MKQVTIQGEPGCFHEEAARRYFGDEPIEIVPCRTFEAQFERMRHEGSLLGIVAIENTIAGSLLQNHELLRRSESQIIGECKLRISHVLAALPGQRVTDIREVHSHPIALMQCGEYLKARPAMKVVERDDTAGSAREIAGHPQLKVVEGEDTARSAEIIKKENLKGHAAICSKTAAERYGMKVLPEGIETNKHNFTRFLVLADRSRAAEFTDPARTDKASLVFTLPHAQGSLSKVLTLLSFYGINLTKIQSLPIIGREWEYRFYVDVTFDDPMRYRQAVDAARPLTSDFRILGEYAEYPNPEI